METIHLIGSEDVQRAGQSIRSSANDMIQASSTIDNSLHMFKLFLDDWLIRFKEVVENAKTGQE